MSDAQERPMNAFKSAYLYLYLDKLATDITV